MAIHPTNVTFHGCKIHLEPTGPEPSEVGLRARFQAEHCASTEQLLGSAIRQWVRGNEPDIPAQKDADPGDSPAKMRQVASALSYNGPKPEPATKHLLLWAASKIELLIRERDQAQAFAKEAQAPPLLAELLDILQAVVGDNGAGEGAADCARRIIKERNQWKAAAQKLVDRKLFTAADACNAGLQAEIAKLQDQATRAAVQYTINLDRLQAERDESRQMHKERVFWEKAQLEEQIANLSEKLTKLRVAVERMLEPCLGEEMRQERMAELHKAMA